MHFPHPPEAGINTSPLPWREGSYRFPLPWREGIKGEGEGLYRESAIL